jgi:tryptophan synthase alpha chain
MGLKRISDVFTNKSDQKIMSLFITAGYPDLDSTPELIHELERSGADIIELGMPFSDPLADGSTIQRSSEVSIANGTTLDLIFDMVKEVRKISEIPIILMGYINPILHYGLDEFFENSAAAGVDGFILPDVPVEEADLIKDRCQDHDLALIYLVAPNTTNERMKLIDGESSGFVYCVSVTGVTGARDGGQVAASVSKFIDRVNANVTKNPVLVGFGIKSHDDAALISQKTDGFVVGSALINHIDANYPNSEWLREAGSFVRDIKYGSQN